VRCRGRATSWAAKLAAFYWPTDFVMCPDWWLMRCTAFSCGVDRNDKGIGPESAAFNSRPKLADHSFDLLPQPSLLSPVERGGDRADVPFADRIAASECARQE
jgi:hypothetical protein